MHFIFQILFSLFVLHFTNNLLFFLLRYLDPFRFSLALHQYLGFVVQRFIEVRQGAVHCFEVRKCALFNIFFFHQLIIDERVGAVVEILVTSPFTLFGNILSFLYKPIPCYFFIQLFMNRIILVDLDIIWIHFLQVQLLIIGARMQK